MKPKFYPYWIREDVANGIYDSKTEDDEFYSNQVVKLFSSEHRTIKAMQYVVKKWPRCTEHNLTNKSINRIAWLGQAACCLRVNAPDYITKKAWWLLPKEIRDRADKNAKDIIESYENRTENECVGSIETENQICF